MPRISSAVGRLRRLRVKSTSASGSIENRLDSQMRGLSTRAPSGTRAVAPSNSRLPARVKVRLSRAGGALSGGVETPGGGWAENLVDSWTSANSHEVDRADRALDEVMATGAWTLSKVAICSTQLRELAAVAKRA